MSESGEPQFRPFSGASNPYRPPEADLSVPMDEKRRIRQEHIGAEANIKSVGSLNVLGGLLVLLGTIIAFSAGQPDLVGPIATVALLTCGVLLHRLDPRGRALYTAMVALMVVGSAITLPGGLALVGMSLLVPVLLVASLWTRRARTVFTREYREEVIPATPGVSYHSALAWVLLALFLLLILAAVIWPSM